MANIVTKPLGMLLLAIYLILVGVSGLIGLIPGIVLTLLALIAGILILVGK